ncbi:hypothetical protein GS397_06130 [Sphingobium yanoikuyae]|jgi:hypothetical protein|uniref:Uncharacterized protein n=1 Tax=Sphingobium yanoikuyae TaxID=13690 RepID=A0A6P1GDV1_SPHYA|nr:MULTISPECIES: hypothetical protein [Sphingobium]QHD66677.1 hypothetical protein GS397_06130 [Sphingobium yanoikuyae]
MSPIERAARPSLDGSDQINSFGQAVPFMEDSFHKAWKLISRTRDVTNEQVS